MQKQDNFVRLCGKIINRYDRGRVTILTLFIPEMVRKEEKINYPKVYFFHEDKTGAEDFLVRDDVVVIAHAATPRKYRQNGQEYISQALVGDSIQKRKSMYELLDMDGSDRGPKEPYMNDFIITGTLSAIRKTGDRSSQIIIDTVNEGHLNNVSINLASQDVFSMRIGDKVTVRGKVVTGIREPKEEGEKPLYYQNFVGFTIAEAGATKKAEKPKAPEEIEFGEKPEPAENKA